jgi:hypothetical protein
MQWLIPVATAVWAFWTWAHDHERERQRERARMVALYVSPFLAACEELQSRIYKIVERGGLAFLRERYPDGAYAEETLYLIVRFFGWSAAVSRYGPYTQDPEVIRLVTACRRAFSTSSADSPVGPFNFFIPEQKALGKAVMNSHDGEFGRELDTISFYDFKELLASPPMSDSASVQQTLQALRDAEDVRDMPGRGRLENAQAYLVDLLTYVEAREGYSLFAGERRKCRPPQEVPSVPDLRPRPEHEPMPSHLEA